MDAKQLLDACVAAAPRNRFVISCLKQYVAKGALTSDQTHALDLMLTQRIRDRGDNNYGYRVHDDNHEPVVACDVRPAGVHYL